MGLIMIYIAVFVVLYFTCQLLFEAIGEIVFSRLHKTKWYRRLAGKEKKETNLREDKSRIGF